MWDYICPRCRREVSKNSHKCPHCGERFPFPIRVPPKCLKDQKTMEEYVHKHIFPKISAEQREYLAQFFTILFAHGFEGGDFGTDPNTGYAWDSVTGSPSVVSELSHHGTYSMKVVSASTLDYVTKSFTEPNPLYVRAYVYLSSVDDSSSYSFFLMVAGTVGVGIVGVNRSLYLRYKHGTTTYYATSSTTLSTGTWYCIEFKIYKDSTNGEYRVYLDGTEVTDLTQTGKNTASYSWNSINVGTRINFRTITAYFDCVVVADTYIGPEAEFILKQWSQTLNTSHVFTRPYRTFKLSQNVNTAHVFRRPFRFMKLTQALKILHTWTLPIGIILKQWIASLNLTHTFKRPFRFMHLTQTLRTIHTLSLKRFFQLLQTLNLSHLFKRPSRQISYTEQLQLSHFFHRPVRLIKFPATLQLTHVFRRPFRFMKLVEQLTLGHAYFVAVPSVKKTRLFLVVGDLAIQLSRD
jgi:DNA-directed RNA polymerase subunit RPC12/RpoP